MNYMRLTTLILVTLLILAACGKSEEPTASTATNELLSYVPADTPYLFANLEPVPEEVIDTFLTRLQPVLDSMQSQLSIGRAEMESVEGKNGNDPGARLAHALLLELDGNLSRSGLESMGFDLRAEKSSMD